MGIIAFLRAVCCRICGEKHHLVQCVLVGFLRPSKRQTAREECLLGPKGPDNKLEKTMRNKEAKMSRWFLFLNTRKI